MAESTPQTTKQWNVAGTDGFDSLEFSEQTIPHLNDNQVLVKIKGASLNYRDLLIPRGTFPFASRPSLIPGSDGAGTVLAIGKSVTRFKPGDNVITCLFQQHIAGSILPSTGDFALGASVDGTFREVGAFDEQGLVHMPKGLNFVEASTLSCAGVTAWNALFGQVGRELRAGQWVLTQGTGGVSLFAVQFAKVIGARVIATTSSKEKEAMLKSLGADEVINYVDVPQWGKVAKDLTGGVGVDLVVEVTGTSSLRESMDALKLDGTMSVVGFVGGRTDQQLPSLLESWLRLFTARGVWCGSRLQMEEMGRAIEGNVDRMKPVVDKKVFKLEELKEAYEYLWDKKHQGNVCIDLE